MQRRQTKTKIQFEVIHLSDVDKFCLQCPAYNLNLEYCFEYDKDTAPLESACVRGYYLIENKIAQEDKRRRTDG